jgi:hypothetical protein
MPGLITRLFPLYGTQSVRVTVAWRKRRIRRVKFEYARPHMFRRLTEALK